MSGLESTGGARLAVAIVGCGIIGVNHARAIARHPTLAIAAVVDQSDAARATLADLVRDELGVDRPLAFGSLTESLAEAEIDIVVICTPSGTHISLAQEALADGRHVVIEKPLDVTVAAARRLAELSREAEGRGLVVSVISQHRFDPASVAVAAAATDGRFGRITSAVASIPWWRGQDYYDSAKWRGTWEFDGGGAVMNQGVHTVDLLVWMLGVPTVVSGQTALLAHDGIEVEDTAVATVSFASGALAVIHATTAAFPGLSARLQVHGTRGSAIIDGDQLEYFSAAAAGDGTSAAAGDQSAAVVGGADLRGGEKPPDQFVLGHLRQYDDIVRSIESGSSPGIRVDDALLSLAVVESIYVSATLGTPVEVAKVLAGAYDGMTLQTGGSAPGVPPLVE